MISQSLCRFRPPPAVRDTIAVAGPLESNGGRSCRMPLALITLVFCLVLPSLCLAMRPTFESLDHVLTRTHAALIADIGSVEEDEKPQFYRLIRFAVIPVETLFGDEVARQSLDCRYRQDLVLRRGDMIV